MDKNEVIWTYLLIIWQQHILKKKGKEYVYNCGASPRPVFSGFERSGLKAGQFSTQYAV